MAPADDIFNTQSDDESVHEQESDVQSAAGLSPSANRFDGIDPSLQDEAYSGEDYTSFARVYIKKRKLDDEDAAWVERHAHTQLKANAAFYFLSPDCPSFKGTTIRMANGEALLKPHEEQVWIIEYMQTDPENSVGFPSPQDLTAMKRVLSRLAYHMKRIRAEIKDIIKGSIENGTSIDILAHTMSGISALSGTNHKPTLALANRMAMMRAHHRSYKGDNLKYWDALDTNIAKILDGNALDGQHQRSYRKDLRKFPMPPLVAQTYTPVNECTQLQRRFDIAICRYRGELHARQLAAASGAEAGSVVVGSPTHPASPSSEG